MEGGGGCKEDDTRLFSPAVTGKREKLCWERKEKVTGSPNCKQTHTHK